MADQTLHEPRVIPSFQIRHSDSAPPGLGALYLGNGSCSFCVWAPFHPRVALRLLEPAPRIVTLESTPDGYHFAQVENVYPGTRYLFQLGPELLRPDPASFYQPDTVHGPSEVVDPDFDWEDQPWSGFPLRDYIIYELHVGTATRDGTFEALIPILPELKTLGINALELMPIAQFPGTRNWGYDGVYPFAVQNSYGGPRGLKRLVNACHKLGLAVILDVVYNHLGPEGNYLRDFGPYFNSAYKTPWGDALNFDGRHSNNVRRFFIENALRWQTEFHLDALRLDAVHAIRDFSAIPFLEQLAQATRIRAGELARPFHLIAESDLNDARIIRSPGAGGIGIDAQWSDDFHHCLHVLLTREHEGYYEDFGGVAQLAKIFREGYAFTGQYSAHRKRNHGNSPVGTSSRQFIVYSQNHDQIGNRPLGDRLSSLISFERLKLAAGAVLLSPFVPMLFMGEEYGEPAPFLYAVSLGEPELVEAVRKGRREEFPDFSAKAEIPDPNALATFERCVLNRSLCRTGKSHCLLHAFYRELIRFRKQCRALMNADKHSFTVDAHPAAQVLSVLYRHPAQELCLFLNFEEHPVSLPLTLTSGIWSRLLDSARSRWGGPGSTAPDRLVVENDFTLEITPLSVTVFGLTREPAPVQHDSYSISA